MSEEVIRVFEVRDQSVNFWAVDDKRATGTELHIASDLVDTHTALNVASFALHCHNLFCPILADALINLVGISKGPSTIGICPPNVVAGIAASTLWWLTAVARATIALARRSELLAQVTLEIGTVYSVGNRLMGGGVETSLDDMVSDFADDVAANVGHVQVEKEAWNAGKGDIEDDLELFATTAVDNDGSIHAYASKVHKLDKGKCCDEKGRDKSEKGPCSCLDLDIFACSAKGINALKRSKYTQSHGLVSNLYRPAVKERLASCRGGVERV